MKRHKRTSNCKSFYTLPPINTNLAICSYRRPTFNTNINKLCAWLRPLQVDNIFVFICQVAPVPGCWRFKTSATSWPLTFWPWKWCPNHVWRGLPLYQF